MGEHFRSWESPQVGASTWTSGSWCGLLWSRGSLHSCGLGHDEKEEVTGVRVRGWGEIGLARKISSPYLIGNSEHGVDCLLNDAN